MSKTENIERIKTMSSDELIELMIADKFCPHKKYRVCEERGNCIECVADWLNDEDGKHIACIKKKTDIELAEILSAMLKCPPHKEFACEKYKTCVDCYIEWLHREEIKEGITEECDHFNWW